MSSPTRYLEPLTPHPTTPSPTRRVGDTIAIPGDYQHRAITQGPRIQRQWHMEKRAMFDWYFPIEPGQQILDVGCGSGVISDAMAHKGGQVLAVDGNSDAVNYGTKTFASDRLQFRLGLVDDLQLPDGAFDRVTCLEVIEHIYEDQGRTLLASLHRVLKPGGKLLVTTPNYRGTWPLVEWMTDHFGPTAPMEAHQHVVHYHRASLRQLVEESGFEVEALRTMSTFSPFVAVLGFRAARAVESLERRIDLPFGNVLAAVCCKR